MPLSSNFSVIFISMDSQFPILFSVLKAVIIILYWVTQVVPTLASGVPFKLGFVSLSYAPMVSLCCKMFQSHLILSLPWP